MASKSAISWAGIGIRYLFALVLVCTTYNPSGASFYHWVSNAFDDESKDIFSAGKIFLGIVLIIGWAIFIRATTRSLGLPGLLLTAAFFGALFWLLYSVGIITTESPTVLIYIGLVLLSAILTTGISWSHIRRRLTGQVDVDELEGDGGGH